MNNIKLTRGERFKDARIERNKHGKQTMDEVTAATGVPKSKIWALENDEIDRGVDYREVGKLAKHYGVSVDWLLCISEHYSPNADVQAAAVYTGLSVDAVHALRQISKASYIEALNDFLIHHGHDFAGEVFLFDASLKIAEAGLDNIEQSEDYSEASVYEGYLENRAYCFERYCRNLARDYGIDKLIERAKKLKEKHYDLEIKNYKKTERFANDVKRLIEERGARNE